MPKDNWVTYEKAEVEKIVKKLAKDGMDNSKIGLVLRDQYGIPSTRAMGLNISKIAPKKDVPEDLYNLLVKAVNLHKHLIKSKKDSTSKHGFEKVESQIRRLAKYYKRKGALPKDWTYTIESAELLVK